VTAVPASHSLQPVTNDATPLVPWKAWLILLVLAVAMAVGNILLGVFSAVQEQAKANSASAISR